MQAYPWDRQLTRLFSQMMTEHLTLFGNGSAAIAELNDDMTSIKEGEPETDPPDLQISVNLL